MNYPHLREELYSFYLEGDAERSKAFADKCFAIMDSLVTEDMTVVQQKLLQYRVITEEFEPVIFKHTPFFYETGVLTSLSDGARSAKGHRFTQANGWVYDRNAHFFKEFDEALYNRKRTHVKEQLYLICGSFNDDSQHFNFNNRPFLKGGLRSVYERAKAQLPSAQNSEEIEFLEAICEGMLCLKRMAERFAEKAEEMLVCESDPKCRKNLELIAKTAKRVPWKKPETFYEALATVAFLRTAFGSLEGAGPNTFGRLDKDLIPFYTHDIESGIITIDEAYSLICQFLIIWDCHYDHGMLMQGYSDHELENTYTLGGCDDEGNPLYNEVTKLFLEANKNENIIFPKIKCRFSKTSPKEYLDLINCSIVNGTSTVLLQNDEATIASLVRSGRPIEEARDYYVTGCWGTVTAQEKYDHGNYVNLLKPLEFAIHRLEDRIAAVGIDFRLIDDDMSFEEIYSTVIDNCEKLIEARIDIAKKGGYILNKVDRFPIFSSSLDGCIENRADYSMNGAKYRDDYYLLFGLPNIVDSLLAIRELVFEKKKYTLAEYLSAVRANWEGFENLRIEATRCHGWGDGSEASCQFANRFNNDLFAICQRHEGSYGGKVHMGHLTYTEIRFWGEKTLATPDGRKNGDYFAQGLTPSRLKKIPCVNDVINSMACIDKSTMAANSVVNIILPSNTPLDRCEIFLRAVATTAVQSLQLNCTSKEELLDAQKHPEKYPHLIVRVTGFSAKFTSLSKEWQDEFISRNFYD